MTNSAAKEKPPFVVGSTSSRIPVEKWSRAELEDRFHATYTRNLELAQRNAHLEKDLVVLNGRLRRLAGRVGGKDEWTQEKNDLERKNRLLAQKLKSLKHQLLVYTRPSAQAATINHLTSRHTTTSRPRSALAHSTRTKDVQPTTSHAEADEFESFPQGPATSIGVAPPPSNPPNPALLQNITDKTAIIRLNRELRECREQAELLRFESERRKQQLDRLQAAFDNQDEELANARRALREYEDSAQHFRADALRSNESSHASAQLAEQELRHLRDEVRLLRSNNEKLEKTIFERETAKRTPTADLAQIKQLEAAVQAIQQQNAELERRRAKAEAERSKLSAKYKKLRSQLEKLSSRLESHSVFPPAPAIAPPAVEVNGNAKHEPPKVERSRRKDSTKAPVGILDRLFDDVVNLVDSHLGRSSSSGSAGREEDNLKDVRWQNMYESMYGELEKVRSMLITEFDINRELIGEKSKLNEEMDAQRRRHEAEVAELRSQLAKFRREVEVLENQLRSIAGGSPVDSAAQLPNGTMRTGEADLVLQFTRLLVTPDGLKKTTTAAPSFFLMLEFFDFEFQITPLIQGPDARLQLSTVYEIVVSDLFVHYLQTDGVHVELYEVLGTSHNLWGSATIPLKSLLTSKSSKVGGRLEIAGESGETVVLLDYELNAPKSLAQALQAQKAGASFCSPTIRSCLQRRQTAATFLPLDGEPPDAADRAELVVRIERARDLRRLWAEDKRPTNPPRLYAAYQLFDLPPHSTPTTTGWDPEFANEHSWSLPLGASLHRYLKAGSLEVQLVDERGVDGQLATRLASLEIPLFPLARNQKIARTFPLEKANGSNSDAQLDVSIFWKEPYSFNDENVEVTPARNAREEPPEQSKKPPAYRSRANEPKTSTSEQNARDRPSSAQRAPPPTAASKPPLPPPQTSTKERESSSHSTEESEEAESVLVVESPDLRDAKPPVAPPIPPVPRPRAVDPNELRRRLSQELGVDEDKTPSPPSARDFDPDLPDGPPLSIVPSTAPDAPLSAVPPSAEFDPPAFSDSDDESGSTFTKDPDDQLDRPEVGHLPEDLMLESDEEEEAIAPQPPGRLLPPLAVRGRAVEFKEPLHSSIPPSETSSFAADFSNGEEAAESSRPPRPPRSQPRLDSPATQSVLRPRPNAPSGRPASVEAEDLPLPDATFRLRVLRVRLLDHSPLLAQEFDQIRCVVEWNLLDFPREECETQELPISRDARDPIDFNFERVYQLSWRRIALLRQWMSLETKLKFVLVLEPSVDGPASTSSGDTADDVAEAALDLQEVIDSNRHTISLFDVEMEPIALLEVEVDLSDALRQHFEELVHGGTSAESLERAMAL